MDVTVAARRSLRGIALPMPKVAGSALLSRRLATTYKEIDDWKASLSGKAQAAPDW
jgi:hypothetical protein